MGNSLFCSEIGQPGSNVHKSIKGGIKPKKEIKSVDLHIREKLQLDPGSSITRQQKASAMRWICVGLLLYGSAEPCNDI